MATNNTSLSLEDLENEEVETTPVTPPSTIETDKDDVIPEVTPVPALTPEEEEEQEEEEEEEKPPVTKTPETPAEEEDPEEEEEDPEAVNAFFEDVSQEVGYSLTDLGIDYEGEDPLGPKGVAKLLKATAEKELSDFDDYLKANHPGAYNHFLASMAGQTDEEFFRDSANQIPLVPTESEVTDSVERQRELVKEDLIARGITRESIIKSTIAQLEEDDELQEEALTVRKGLESLREAKIKENETKANEKVAQEVGINNEVSEALSVIMKTGVISKGLTLPKEDRKKAIESFKENLRVENGELFIVQKVDPKDVASALGKNYIGNKASLDKIIEKKAGTQNVIRLRKQMEDESKTKGKAGQSKRQAGGGFTPLDELE